MTHFEFSGCCCSFRWKQEICEETKAAVLQVPAELSGCLSGCELLVQGEHPVSEWECLVPLGSGCMGKQGSE